jgi:hypothetical protein
MPRPGLLLVVAAIAFARPVVAAPRQGVIVATCELFKAWRAVKHAEGAELVRARSHLAHQKAELCKRLSRAPGAQLLRGAFVDGPKALYCEAKKHPLRTAAVLLGAVGLCTAASMAGLPIDTIALWASAGLTAKVIAGNWRKVHAAFKKHSRTRWRLAGQDLVFPAAAFAAGLGMGAAVEGATRAVNAEGALGLGLKSTAQTVDDLVPITEVLGKPHKGQPTAR